MVGFSTKPKAETVVCHWIMIWCWLFLFLTRIDVMYVVQDRWVSSFWTSYCFKTFYSSWRNTLSSCCEKSYWHYQRAGESSYSLAAATRQPCGVAGNVPQGSACPQGTRGERRGKALDRLFEGAEHLVEDRFCLSTYPSRWPIPAADKSNIESKGIHSRCFAFWTMKKNLR